MFATVRVTNPNYEYAGLKLGTLVKALVRPEGDVQVLTPDNQFFWLSSDCVEVVTNYDMAEPETVKPAPILNFKDIFGQEVKTLEFK